MATASATVPMSGIVPHNTRNVIVVGLAIVLAVGGIVLGTLGIMQARSAKSDLATTTQQLATTRQDLSTLSQKLATSQSAISSLTANSQAGAVSTLHASMNTLQAQMGQFMVCVPEVQQEVTGLSISSDTTGGYVTNSYLSNPTIVSSNCSKVLQGGP